MKDLDSVLGFLGRAGFTLKLKKCCVFKVDYLGPMIMPRKLVAAM